MHPKWIVLGGIAAAILSLFSVYGYHVGNPTYTVMEKTWTYQVNILKEELVTESGWQMPEDAHLLRVEPKYSKTITPVVTQEPIPRTILIPYSFPCGKITCTGFMPITSTDLVDIYGEPYDVFESWYTYQYLKKTSRSVEKTGTEEQFTWPDVVLENNEHEVSRVEFYSVHLEDWFDNPSSYLVARDEWLAIHIGDEASPPQ